MDRNFCGELSLCQSLYLKVYQRKCSFSRTSRGRVREKLGQLENNLKCIQQTTRQGAVLTFGRSCKKDLTLVTRVATRYSRARELLFLPPQVLIGLLYT